jgi:ribonuclease R
VRGITARRGTEPIKRAYNLIEELMVAANEAVAQMFERADKPTVWRVHPPPDGGSLAQLCRWLAAYGIKSGPQQLREPRGMAAIARRIQRHRAAHPLSYLLLRTLKQAAYHVENKGHFGLASPAYLHFTSPIRRYPDLHAHRLLKRLLREDGRPAGRRQRVQQTSRDALQSIAREASARERQALEVERAAHSIYAASLMRDRVGDEAWARVVGMTRFGFFANLDEPFVDGLVRFARLGEPFTFDADLLRATGRRTGRVISLGDSLRVRVVRADVIRRQIDMELVSWAD